MANALKNLDDEAVCIARDNPRAATELVKHVLDMVDALAEHPALGRPGRVPGTRELIITGTPYLIPYRVKGEAVEILRVFHGSRRWPSSFED
ncbi:MAG: type II toxin-antitoxin system RelE/ParE family toxin [Syntrophobacter sp.]